MIKSITIPCNLEEPCDPICSTSSANSATYRWDRIVAPVKTIEKKASIPEYLAYLKAIIFNLKTSTSRFGKSGAFNTSENHGIF